MIQNSLSIVVAKNATDAIAQGFNYKQPEYKSIEIEKVVVVEDGTMSSRSTVDLILKDESGQKYVVMLTGRLLKSIPC